MTELISEIETLRDAFTLYAKEFPDRSKSVKTALLRYLLPYEGFGLDFKVEANQRLKRGEIARRFELTAKFKLEALNNIQRVMTWQEQVFVELETPANVRSVYKCHLNHFLEWCEAQGWLKPPKPKQWEIPLNHPGSFGRLIREDMENYPITNRHNLVPYSVSLDQLSLKVKTQLEQYQAFWADPYYGARPIPKPIETETCEQYFQYTLQLLGWLALDKLDYHQRMWEYARLQQQKKPNYQSDWLLISPEPPFWLKELHEKYPPKSPSQLTLEDLVPVVELRPSILATRESEPDTSSSISCPSNPDLKQLLAKIQEELKAQNASFSFELSVQLGQALQENRQLAEEIRRINQTNTQNFIKEKAQVDAQEAGKYVRGLFADFFKWLEYQHNPTKSPDGYLLSIPYRVRICYTLMNLTKFLYREITNPLMFPDYKDIPVVMSLRATASEVANLTIKSNVINPIKRNPMWHELGYLLTKLLENCSPRHEPEGKYRKNFGRIRCQKAVATDFQKYLIIMFFRLISPDRQHVIRQLTVGDTLKLYYLNLKTDECEEAPWDSKLKRYKVYYNTYTKLYYLDPKDAKDERDHVPELPKGKAFEWVVDLDASQTKIDKESAYRVPKIYNPELQAWLYGREDCGGTWHNWPTFTGTRQTSRYRKQQFNWCGYVNVDTRDLSGFRDILKPQHNFVFTQLNGKPFNVSSLGSLYEAIVWKHLGIRTHPHGVRSAATTHYEKKGMTDAQSKSLAAIKSHSPQMQDSPAYNKTKALDKTKLASEMIINEFLEEFGLDPNEYGLHSNQ
jgi:hypothetical protein